VVAAGKQSSRGLRKMIKQRAYGLPANFESGEGYEVDALNAYKPKEFAKLINSQIEPPYFDEDVHKQILEREEFQAETIDAKIREKIAFLNEDENG
jgi:hypothetical protein